MGPSDRGEQLINDVIIRMDPDDQHVLAQGLEAFMAAVTTAPAEDSIDLLDGQIIPWLM